MANNMAPANRRLIDDANIRSAIRVASLASPQRKLGAPTGAVDRSGRQTRAGLSAAGLNFADSTRRACSSYDWTGDAGQARRTAA